MDKLIHSRDSYQILDYYPGCDMFKKYNVKQCRSGAYYSSLVFQAINKNKLIRTLKFHLAFSSSHRYFLSPIEM